jgi:Ca2+-binding RTX toxin-like protein
MMNLLGTEASETISWSATELKVDAGDGNDTVNTGSFNDTITGGKGNDTLKGNSGNDTYIFNCGDGIDTIIDTSGLDKIVFGSDDGVGFLINDGKLNISYNSGDNIVINSNIERYERSDGSYLTDADVNYIIQQITLFSKDKGVNFSTADDVRKNDELSQWIMAQWKH